MAWRPEYWGIELSVDLFNCNPGLIRDAGYIRQAVYELCNLCNVRRFGDCQVVHFGEDDRVAGFSMVQLIETSLISGHFANATNSAYINVFSCKPFDIKEVSLYLRKTFKAGQMRTKVNPRLDKFDMRAVAADVEAAFDSSDVTREQVIGWLVDNHDKVTIRTEDYRIEKGAGLQDIRGAEVGEDGTMTITTRIREILNAGEQAGTAPTT